MTAFPRHPHFGFLSLPCASFVSIERNRMLSRGNQVYLHTFGIKKATFSDCIDGCLNGSDRYPATNIRTRIAISYVYKYKYNYREGNAPKRRHPRGRSQSGCVRNIMEPVAIRNRKVRSARAGARARPIDNYAHFHGFFFLSEH